MCLKNYYKIILEYLNVNKLNLHNIFNMINIKTSYLYIIYL